MNLLSGQPIPQDQAQAGDGFPASSSAASRSPLARSHEQALFRLDLRRSLHLHRRLALGIALIGFAGAIAYLLTLWPIYNAQSLVYIQPAPPRVMDQGAPARWPFDSGTYDTYIQQQVQTVSRPDVLTAALKKLEPGTWQKSGESDQAAAERLRRTIEVTRVGISYQISITAHASNAAMAAKLANAVTAGYLEGASREAKAGDAERLSMLRDERDRVQREMAADRSEQQVLNKQLGVAAVGAAAPDPYDEDVSRVREELTKARTAHDEASARLTAMGAGRSLSSASMDAEADELITGDAGLISLKTTLNQRRVQIASQMANLTPNHPQYKLDAQELAQINSSQESMMKDLRAKASVRIQQRLRNDLERTSGVETQLNAQLGQMTAAAGGMTPKMQRANDLATDITRLQARYSTVDDQWRNLLLDVAGPGAAYLSTAAVPPLHAVRSGVLRNTMLIAFAGLMLGIISAVGVHKFDSRVYIASDVEQVLGFAPMAVLPDFLQVSDGVAEEHLLRLSAGIEYAHQQGNLKSCIFTGTGPGAGVTTVATRVRSMLETMGKGTVLVDASGTPPPPPRAASPAGSSHDSSGRVASQRGSRSSALVQQLAEEAETGEQNLVLTDTAPLAVSAETEYLARFVDAAIVVVESGVTTRAQLRDTADTLQRLDVAAVGFVLNRVNLEKADPAFRKSVHDIEQHLQAQSRSTARRTERSLPSAPAAPEAASKAPRQEQAEKQAEPAAPKPSVKAPVQPRVPAMPELSASRPEPATVPLRVPRPEPVEVAAQHVKASLPGRPLRQISDEAPAQPPPLPDAPRHTVPSPPEPVRDLPPDPVSRPSATDAFHAIPHAEPEQVREFRPAGPVAVPTEPRLYPTPPPAQSWDRVSNRLEDVAPEPAVVQRQEPPFEMAQEDAATRLSGLRNLLYSLGLKSLNKSREYAEQEPEAPMPVARPRVEEPPERPAFARPPHAPIRHTTDYDSGATASPTLVTAAPEFLPPTPMAEVDQKDHAWANSPNARRDRRDSYDEVQILPSWRGQYKKKKQPLRTDSDA